MTEFIQSVDLVASGCDIVTLDPENRVISDGAIVIDKGRILWMGPASEAKGYLGRETLDVRGKIAMPGMIDSHYHTAQQLLRGKLQALSRQGPLKPPIWKNYLIPWEAGLDPEDVYLSGLVAYTNMIQVGTTCFAEAGGPHPDEMGRAAMEVGIRGYISQSTVDQSETGPNVADSMIMSHDEALEKNVSLVNRWKDNDRVSAWFSLRQIMVCSPELIRDICHEAQIQNVKVHTHLCEGTYEIDYATAKFGMRPAEWLDSIGCLTHHLHCAHSILLSPNEMDLYVKNKPSACQCAFNNYSIGAHKLTEMWRRGIDIGLGTDGPGSGGTIDIFQVAHATRIAQQAVNSASMHDPWPITAEEVLRVATHGGARSLGIFDQIGSLEIGKKADIIFCDTDQMDHQPIYDSIFVAANTVVGRDISSVVVDGAIIMEKREIKSVDTEEIMAKLKKRLPVISARFEKLIAKP